MCMYTYVFICAYYIRFRASMLRCQFVCVAGAVQASGPPGLPLKLYIRFRKAQLRILWKIVASILSMI